MSDKKQVSLLAIVGEDAELMEQITRRDQLLVILNSTPPKKWVKNHPTASGVKYLPIDKVELLLTRIFQDWFVEIIHYSQVVNAVSVHVRLKYKDPVTQEWFCQDGIGAVDIQTASGSKPTDFNAIISGAIQRGLPAAKSEAIKDASHHIGVLFGRDLNRNDTEAFASRFEDGTAEAKEKARKKLDEDNQA